MKSFLIIAAYFVVGFQDICQTTACGIEQMRNSSTEYFNETALVHLANQPGFNPISSEYLFSNSQNELGDQKAITTEKFQIRKYRTQLVAHFNVIMSKKLKRSQHSVNAGTNQL